MAQQEQLQFVLNCCHAHNWRRRKVLYVNQRNLHVITHAALQMAN